MTNRKDHWMLKNSALYFHKLNDNTWMNSKNVDDIQYCNIYCFQKYWLMLSSSRFPDNKFTLMYTKTDANTTTLHWMVLVFYGTYFRVQSTTSYCIFRTDVCVLLIPNFLSYCFWLKHFRIRLKYSTLLAGVHFGMHSYSGFSKCGTRLKRVFKTQFALWYMN